MNEILPNMRLLVVMLTSLAFAAPGSRAQDSRSPLADAVQQQARAVIHTLLQRPSEASVNAAQADGMTALHWAVYHNDVETTQRLLTAGANVNAENRYGISPLSTACLNGNTVIVQSLLEAGGHPKAVLLGGESLLMTAARTGRVGPVQALIAAGADIHATDRKGQNALMWAAADGHDAVVDALVKSGADPRIALPSGFTPLFFAVREGKTNAVRRLLEAGIDVNETMQVEKGSNQTPAAGTSPLLLAVENGHFELATMLLDAGADPNPMDIGYTALHAITWVRKPLRGDGDPAPIGSGRLHSLDFVRLLVEYGADVNARHGKRNAGNSQLNKTDATPLLLAAEASDLPLLRLLIELEADPSLTNADNCTAFLAAAGVGVLSGGDETAGTEAEAIETLRFLLELGADINAVDDLGNAAMHGAAYKSHTQVVQLLSDQGADVNIWNRPNKRGWTPLLIAQGNRPGNFRPSPETIEAVERALRTAGVEPPKN